MKNIIISFSILLWISSFGQNIPDVQNDPHWEIIENWDFTNMPDFDQRWQTADNFNIRQATWPPFSGDIYGYSEPAFYDSDNITHSSEGTYLAILPTTTTNVAHLGYQPNEVLPSDLRTNERTENYLQAMMRSRKYGPDGYQYHQYGYIEGKFKIPFGFNFHAGFWMFGDGFFNSDGREIDIFEMVPMNSEDPGVPVFPFNNNVQKTNVHLGYGTVDNPTDKRNKDIIISDYTNWHIYGLEWNPDWIIWYFDGIEIRRMENPGIDHCMSVIANFSLNPRPYGPDLNGEPRVNTNWTAIPSTMRVEYIKWYQLKSNCAPLNDCNYDINSHSPEVRSYIDIMGCGSQTISPGNSIYLSAEQYTIIEGDFVVPVGAELTISSESCYSQGLCYD